MDAFLLILTVVIALFLLALNVYFMVYFLDDSEKGFGDSWFCKVVVVLGLMLAWAQVLTLPLDVANSRGNGAGLDVDFMWQVIYVVLFFYVVLLLPTTFFYYESDEDDTVGGRLCYTLKHLVFIVIVVGLILTIMFGVLGFSSIPVQGYSCNYSDAVNSESTTVESHCDSKEFELEIDVTFPIYVMGLLSFAGWFLLVIYGGIGLSAVPLDLINSYRFRPKRLTLEERTLKRQLLRDKAADILRIGKELRQTQAELTIEDGWLKKRKLKNHIRKTMNQLQAEILLLENDFDVFKQEQEYSGVKTWVYPLFFVLGVLCGLVTLL